MENKLIGAREAWLTANLEAVSEAQKYLNKKGEFNPPLEKPWPKYAILREIADNTWFIYYNLLVQQNDKT